ncbi:MAG TPA: autorepressor SdpR family transcription factor [Bacteroidia bacterium]|nr:autorepressor SdpR family transcription factor [Bacteroidia bacterium]
MNLLFKALGDPTRRKIIELLRKKDMTAGEIADAFTISKPSISHHLDILRQADIVISVKEGQFITYSLNTTVFDDVVKWTMDIAQAKNKSKK